MYALTLTPEWAYAVCHLGKRTENRTWYPPESQLRAGDWFAIHSGKPPKTLRGRVEMLQDAIAIANKHGKASKFGVTSAEVFKYGIVALARYAGRIEKADFEGRYCDAWWEGPCGWMLSEVRVLQSVIPIEGRQKLWKVPEDVAEKLRRNLLDNGN